MKKWLDHWPAAVVFLLMAITMVVTPAKTEVDQLVLISGMGIEKEDGGLFLCAEIAPTGEKPEPEVVSVVGKNLEECLLRMEEALPGDAYWGGTSILLLNEQAAQDGALLLEIYEQRELSPGMKPVLAAGDCSTLLAAGFAHADTAAGTAMNLSLQENSLSLMEYLRSMAEGQAPMLPILFLADGKVRIRYAGYEQ